MKTTRRALLAGACALALAAMPAAYAATKPQYGSTALALVLKAKSRSKTHTHFLLVSGYETRTSKSRSTAVTAYVVSVRTTQLTAASTAALQNLSSMTGSAINVDAVRARIHEEIAANISGAVMQELRPEQLTALLGGQGFRTGNAALAMDGGGDLIEGVLTTGGAFAGVAATSAGAVPVSYVFMSNAAIGGGAGIAVASAGYGAYSATSALLDITGANSGYTLGDFLYDLTHPGESGNRVWGDGGSTPPPPAGTTLPPDFDTASDPGRNIVFQIVMGLATGTAFGRNVIARPTTLAGTPVPGADGATNLGLLLRFDAMFGGTYFKLVQRSLDARRNGASTNDPDIVGGTSRGPILVDYSRCPPANLQSMRLASYLSSIQSNLSKAGVR